MIPHSIKAPLASAFVLPGVGQVINRQPAKAVSLILFSGIFFAVALFFTLKEVNQALASPAFDQAPEGEAWRVLSEQLQQQGAEWLWVLAAIWMAVWCYGVVDALIWGIRIDAATRQD